MRFAKSAKTRHLAAVVAVLPQLLCAVGTKYLHVSLFASLNKQEEERNKKNHKKQRPALRGTVLSLLPLYSSGQGNTFMRTPPLVMGRCTGGGGWYQ